MLHLNVRLWNFLKKTWKFSVLIEYISVFLYSSTDIAAKRRSKICTFLNIPTSYQVTSCYPSHPSALSGNPSSALFPCLPNNILLKTQPLSVRSQPILHSFGENQLFSQEFVLVTLIWSTLTYLLANLHLTATLINRPIRLSSRTLTFLLPSIQPLGSASLSEIFSSVLHNSKTLLTFLKTVTWPFFPKTNSF